MHFKQIRTDKNKMGRKAKEMNTEVKEMVWTLLQDGKTINYVSETLGISRSTTTSFKKRVNLRGSLENIPRRGRKIHRVNP